MKRRVLHTISALCAALWLVQPAAAAEQFRSSYTVSVLGLKVASSSFQTTLDKDALTIRGSLRSSGLVRLFDDTTGNTTVTARLGKKGVEPGGYDVRYVSGRKKKHTAIRFAGGVARATNSPPLKKKGNYIELKPGDLKGVWDPMTALILRAETPAMVCGRTIRVFDGETRADLKLLPAGRVPFSTKGFKGDAVRCKVKFIPVSGYRAGKQQIDYLAKRARMEVLFAPMGTGDLWAPVRGTVGTKIGPVKIYATQFASK